MMRKLWQVQARAWALFGVVAVFALASAVIRTTGLIEASQFLYVWQPLILIALAVLARLLAGGLQDRARHHTEKATIVGSIVAIWFVVYMVSGVFVTFVENTLVASFTAVALNVFAFGVAAAMLEYTRYKLMLLAGRRNAVWFGVIVACVFALQQMSLTQVSGVANAAEWVELLIGTFVPIIVASFLLTYLAISSGLAAMLTYQLGVVAATILPPIIPKYDWYLLGVSSILLTVAVYVAIDRDAQSKERVRGHAQRRSKRAYDIMLMVTMAGLVLFVTGAFSYKPTVILSNSMKPVFSRGAAVIVERGVSPVDIREGDIIQYEAEGKNVTHRVVNIDTAIEPDDWRFTTKGDNSPSKDRPVKAEQVVGVVRSQVPYIGYPTVWLREFGRSGQVE